MGRPAKAPKLKEPVKLRQRERNDGVQSLYLDIYYKGIRKTEYLKLYLVPEKTQADRNANKRTMEIAKRMQAQRIMSLQKHDVLDFETIRMSGMTLEDWLTKYDNEDITLSKSAFINRQKAHKWMTKFLKETFRPDITVVEVDKDFCRAFTKFLLDAKSDATHKKDDQSLHQSTVHNYIATISAAMNKAVRDGIIDANPFAMLEAKEKVAKKDEEREFLTMDELRILMDTPIDHYSMKQAFLFSCFTGLRISDIIKLTWDDIKTSADGRTQYVRTKMEKTDEYVTVPLSKEALKWMPEKTDNPLVFYDLPKSRNTRNKSVKNWMAAAGITKKITYHSSRHTFATLMLTLGGDLYTTSKLLGHANVHTTEIYAKIIDKKKIETVNLLDNMFGGDN